MDKTIIGFFFIVCTAGLLASTAEARRANPNPNSSPPRPGQVQRARQEARAQTKEARGARRDARTKTQEAREARRNARELPSDARREVRGELREARQEVRETRQEARAQTKEARGARRDARRQSPQNERNARRRRAARRATWRAVQARTGATRPEDIKPPVRAELRTHARRMARLNRARQMAIEANDEAATAKANQLLLRERTRHNRHMNTLAQAATPSAAENTENSASNAATVTPKEEETP